MNIFVFVIFSLFIVSMYADFYVIQKNPTTNISSTTQELTIQINQTVNRPLFQTFIHICNATNNESIYQIDVHLNTSNVTYSNNILTFMIPQYNINDEIYITFDVGVLFSNSSVNSTAQNSPQFWPLKVIASDTTTSITITTENTSVGTTYIGTTGSSMVYSGTSAFTVTQVTSTYTSVNQTTQNLITTMTTSTVPVTAIPGESPPTRSAQIGMGLGITFITLIIIGEIIYFKYCYSGNGRSDSYFT